MWYVAQFGTELGKPLRFYQEGGMLVLLIKSFNYELTWQQALLGYIALMLTACVIGWFLVKIGIVKYNTSLANKQNSELKEILRRVKRIEKKIR